MALMKCPECNKEISDTTSVCIHCGYKIGSNSQKYIHPFVKKVVPIIFVLLVIFIIININKNNESDSSDNLVSCDDLSHFIDIAKTNYANEHGYNINKTSCEFAGYIKYTDTGEYEIKIACESPNKLYNKTFKYKCSK